MSNDLALINSLPEHIRALVKPVDAQGNRQTYREEFGHLDQQDFGLNFLKMCYQSSRPLTGVWPTPDGKQPPLGTMFLSRSGQIIPVGTAFIPLRRATRYILWEGKPGDGRMVFSTQDPKDPQITSINGLTWKKDANTGKPIPPSVTEYVSFYIMLPQYDYPVILSFKRKGMAEGRQLTQMLMEATQFSTIPQRSFMFVLNAPRETREGQFMWFNHTIQAAGFTPPSAIEKASKLSELAAAIDQATSDLDLVEGGREDAEPPKTVQGSVVTEQATASTVSTAQRPAPQAQGAPAPQAAPGAATAAGDGRQVLWGAPPAAPAAPAAPVTAPAAPGATSAPVKFGF
jgi:hypothetical protein